MTEKVKTFLTREALMKETLKPEVHEVYIEALDQHVYMKELSASEQDSYEFSIITLVDAPDGKVKTERNLNDMKSKYLVRALCDENGRRLFKDNEYPLIGSRRREIIVEMYQKALEVNKADQKAVEDSEKNLEGVKTDASNSD